MRQFSGFEIVLVLVILAGVGVFVFSLFDSPPEPDLPIRAVAQSVPVESERESREMPSAGGASTEHAGDPGEVPAKTRKKEAPSVAPGREQIPSDPATSVPNSRNVAPDLATPQSTSAQTPSASESSDEKVRVNVGASRSSGGGSGGSGGSAGASPAPAPSRAPSQSNTPASRSAGASSPGAAGTLTVYPGNTGSEGASGAASSTPPPALGGDDGGQIDDAPPASSQDLSDADPSPPLPPFDDDDEEDPDEPEPLPPPLVLMAPNVAELGVGQYVEVVVTIANAADVGHVPFHVAHDPDILRFNHGDEGPFLKSDGRPTAFFAAPTTTPGTVVVGLSRLGREAGVSGGGILCTLHFEAVGSGNATLSFQRANVRGSDHSIIEASFPPASILVY